MGMGARRDVFFRTLGAGIGAAALVAAAEPEPGFWEALRAARRGDPAAQARVGRMFHRGEGVTRDLAEALRWYRRAAEAGNPDGAYGLGVLHAGDPQDAAVFRENGNRLSRDALAMLGIESPQPSVTGTGPDPAGAVRWFRRAAQQGHPMAQYRLGLAYLRGEGAPRDPEKAYFWLGVALRHLRGAERKAAEAALEEAGRNLSAFRKDRLRGRIRTWRPRN